MKPDDFWTLFELHFNQKVITGVLKAPPRVKFSVLLPQVGGLIIFREGKDLKDDLVHP